MTKDNLFVLIKSLNKGEKRNFQLQYQNLKSLEDQLFVQLFNLLDGLKDYDEKVILKKIPKLKKHQLANVKAHLYKQVLSSLRMLARNKNLGIALRELLDYATILYHKGLHQQSLKLLSKIKNTSNLALETGIYHEVLEFEKLIEARHITRSIENRAELLSFESAKIGARLLQTSELSNLSLTLYGVYLKNGHARNNQEAESIKQKYQQILFSYQPDEMSFHERSFLYMAYCWYYYMLQDFALYYRYTRKWMNLFDEFPVMIKNDPGLYLKALHNLLTAYFFTLNKDRFTETLKLFEGFINAEEQHYSENMRASVFVYYYNARINQHFLQGTFSEGLDLIPSLIEQINKFEAKIDQHRVMVFHYKIACLYFGSGDNHQTISYLNKIINLKIDGLRSDIQCFTRILHLIAHYELENYSLVEYLVRSVYRFIAKHEDMSMMIKEIMRFLRMNIYTDPKNLSEAFTDLRDRLITIANDPYERRSFLYLDIISWLESKIQKIPVQDIMQEKFKYSISRI